MDKESSFTVRDLPRQERPRERLQKFGPEALSAQELLALVIGRGIPKKSVMNIAQELLAKFGNVKAISQADYRRAERLPWARPLMESPERSEIKVFDYVEGPKDKGIRRYVWLDEYDYVLILQRKKKAFYWITAFYVDTRWKREDMKKRFVERV